MHESLNQTNLVTLLVTFSGQDIPGITAEMTRVLATHGATLLDIDQGVVQKLLSLSLYFETQSSEETLLKDLLFAANRLNLKMSYQRVEPKERNQSKTLHSYAVTLLADQISAGSLSEVTQALARYAFNIDRIKRLSASDLSCVEMKVSSPLPIQPKEIRRELLEIAKDQSVDIAFQAENLYRRSKRLVVLDMDSTLIQSEVIDELAREKGVYDQVAQITGEAMKGAMNYDESLIMRTALLKGLTRQDLETVFRRLSLSPGAGELIRVLKKLGYKIALISGGFTFVANRMKEALGIDFAFANELEIQNGILTGRVIPPFVNAQRKADLLQIIADQERIVLDQVVAIGDGANDLLMLEKAGLGIAFHAKPVVREKADMAFSQKNMRSILYLLGLSSQDVEEALDSQIYSRER